MDQTADVVVVGGGVIGCFIAYELSKAGLRGCGGGKGAGGGGGL